MTTDPVVGNAPGASWTVEDLTRLPNNGTRFEILNGSLLVTPPPDNNHGFSTQELTYVLARQVPPHLYVVGTGLGVNIRGGETYFIPDLAVVPRSVFGPRRLGVDPPDVLLVVEVLSPGNARNDLVVKRREYADAGIARYWIVDRDKRTMTVLALDAERGDYVEETVVRPGQRWKTEEPFPLTLDVEEIFTT
jgi:Uma2 family endonuclease